MKRWVLGLLVCLVAAAPAAAAPSFLGHTGLLLTPTADALDAQQWNVTFHHISDNASIAAGTFGLAAGLEVGAVWFDPQGRGSDARFTAHAKYRILPETATGVGLAVGWWDVADEVNSSPYGVVSKRLTNVGQFPLRGHLGLGGGIYDGVFAGADLPIAESLQLMAEWDTEDLNAGIRWGLPQGFRVDAGFISSEFGVGASFNSRF